MTRRSERFRINPIPRPRGGHGGVTMKEMKLKRWKYSELTNCVSSLSAQYLDLSKPYSFQDPRLLKVVHDEAIKMQPFFEQYYEGAWPLKQMISKYLSRKGFEIRSKAKLQQIANATETRDKYPAAGEAAPSPPVVSTVSTTLSRPSSSSIPRPSTFLEFLQSCEPTLGQYIANFQHVGITDESGVHMLIGWSMDDRATLMEDDMGLKPVDCTIVRHALENLQTSGNRVYD